MNLGSARLFEPATSLGLVLRLRGREILCPFFSFTKFEMKTTLTDVLCGNCHEGLDRGE